MQILPNIRMNVDGRTLLGGLLIAGYMLLLRDLIGADKAIANVELVKDGFLILGPLIGAVGHAIWRQSGSEERQKEILVDSAAQSLPQDSMKLLPAPHMVERSVAAGTEQGVERAVTDLVRDGAVTGMGETVSIGLRDRPLRADTPHATDIIE